MALLKIWIFLAFAYIPFVAAGPHLRRQGTTLQTSTTSTTYTQSVPTTQSASNTNAPEATGSLVTELETKGAVTSTPVPSGKTSTTGKVKVNAQNTLEPAAAAAATSSVNVFVPIATATPATSLFPRRGDNPAPVRGITNTAKPLNTNKFYANFFLENQFEGTWTHPYALTWVKNRSGSVSSWGMGVSQTDLDQFGYAPGNAPVQYYLSPTGVYSIVFSAAQLGSSTTLTVDSDTAFSANINLKSGTSGITFPVTQGMGFVTAIYQRADVRLQSAVAFLSITFVKKIATSPPIFKYRLALQDGKNWLMYVTPSGSTGRPPFVLTNNKLITGPTGFNGIIQVSKNPVGTNAENTFDNSAGVYATSVTLSGSTTGSSGTYSLSWGKGGITSRPLLMYALPHHVASFDSGTAAGLTNIKLRSTTKGTATAVVGNKFTMIENNLPLNYGFLPWQDDQPKTLTSAAYARIEAAAVSELSQNMTAQCVLDSMYFSGKALAKFAQIILVANDVAQNSSLAAAGLTKLKQVFDVFVQNKQPNPLAYDTRFRGVISTALFRSGNSLDDFGSGYYNDHHFHYGYFVYTAAVIGYLDPSWLTTGKNKAWVTQLLRDYANPSTSDTAYAQSRAFDWYHGHSWAKGLYASTDGKDQESTSEDVFSSYAVKMWGRTIGDPAIEGRGNLMLAVQTRSFQNYFLMDSSNTNQPARFIGNKVTGILFENKCDHTTYFGTNIEYIQGIHMIPLSPLSPYSRTNKFVMEEWNTYFSNGRVDQVAGGWRGILYANLAIIDAVKSYSWFSGSSFSGSYLDGGASLTWYLAFSAGLGGALA